MNILVTGGAGYIGSHLVEKLINNTDKQLNSILATIHNQSKIELNDKSIKKKLLNLSNTDILEITLLCKLLKNTSF